MVERRPVRSAQNDARQWPNPADRAPFIACLMEAVSSAGEWAASSMCRRGRSPTIGRKKRASSGFAPSSRPNSEICKMLDRHPLGSASRDPRHWSEEASAGPRREPRSTNSGDLQDG